MLKRVRAAWRPLRSLARQQRLVSTEAVAEQKSTSKAMKAYLERAREHDEFMTERRHEFQIGKRHLANMMGEDPETFTQEDIDRAIEYLFPSGLFEKKARPIMKPPEEIFPQRKAAEFDETGRPHHFLFYTGRPHLYQLLHDIVRKINELNKFEDAMVSKGLSPDPNLALQSVGFEWVSKVHLENALMESLSDRDYNTFVNAIQRLSSLPYAYKEKEFIMGYKKALLEQIKLDEIPKPQLDEDGREFISVYECRRKSSIGNVTLWKPGTGKITINGEDITYFREVQSREQLLFPLIFTDMLDKVDVVCHVEKGGWSSQAGALRWGIATALRSFLDGDSIERMRVAGLLTKDFRTRERKKPGQAGARRKFTWKKR
ncbi:small ribosomal subunit protein uS9m [Cylas formicarius]|uniref:small ribosomal subunit protein uS9m n=1 Tax=Cylas formicarius TaxID=197179 RepID=UPI002958AAAC|nr:small ribosomal subunit protein uS9m [Cylas formicarius]